MIASQTPCRIDELMLKKWIGQMLDAMTFVHDRVGRHVFTFTSRLVVDFVIIICFQGDTSLHPII